MLSEMFREPFRLCVLHGADFVGVFFEGLDLFDESSELDEAEDQRCESPSRKYRQDDGGVTATPG